MAINITYGPIARALGLAQQAGDNAALANRRNDDLQAISLGNSIQHRIDADYNAGQDRLQRAALQDNALAGQQAMFRLTSAAHADEFDRELSARSQQDVANRTRALNEFAAVYPEYADMALKAGRPLNAGEISDLRETANQQKRQQTADELHKKQAALVQATGRKDFIDYFDATGKLPAEMTSAKASNPNATALKELQEQLKVYDQDFTFADSEKKGATYDPKREKTDNEASVGRTGYQSPYRRSSTEQEATQGSEQKYRDAVNRMVALQAQREAVRQKILALTTGQQQQQQQPAGIMPAPQPAPAMLPNGSPAPAPGTTYMQQPPVIGQPGSTPTPGAPMQPVATTPEQVTNHLMTTAAALKVSPSIIKTLPPPPAQVATAVFQAVIRQFSDPAQQRQAYYDALVRSGFDPSKLAQAPGMVPGAPAVPVAGQ